MRYRLNNQFQMIRFARRGQIEIVFDQESDQRHCVDSDQPDQAEIQHLITEY